mmetsp:Transcript_153430/g.272020  ORF Transcript_153430/g.272020 Transcript_153430/m.272020 type:complete len:340 (+) Transcript_153430:2-1021(+)
MGSRGGSGAAPVGSPSRRGVLSGSLTAPVGNWGLLGGSANAPAGGLTSHGGSSAAPVGSVGSLSSRGPNSARSCEGFPGPPRRSCSLTVPCAPSARGGQSLSATFAGSARRMTSSPSSSGFPGQHAPLTPGRARPVAVEVLAAGPTITSTPSRDAGTGASRRALSASTPSRRHLPSGPSITSPRQPYLVAHPMGTAAAVAGNASLNSSTTDLMGSMARQRQNSQGPPGMSSSLAASVRGSSLTVPTYLSAEPEDATMGFEIAAAAAAGTMGGMSLPNAPCGSLLSGGAAPLGAAAVSAAAISAVSQLNMTYALPSASSNLGGHGGLPTMPSLVNTADLL